MWYNSSVKRLPTELRAEILHALVEGNSLRGTARLLGVSFNAVMKLLVDAGGVCEDFHDRKVRGIRTRRIQCDEIWSFCYVKRKNLDRISRPYDGAGDIWTWIALDQDTKLAVSWMVGGRNSDYAREFAKDLESRIENRVQLTTDGLNLYIEAVEEAFHGQVDYAQLVKLYDEDTGHYAGADKRRLSGRPDPDMITTAHV